jgi:hypothetical protein
MNLSASPAQNYGSFSAGGVYALLAPGAVTQTATITATGAGQISSFNANVTAVPDGAVTIGLLGLVLAGVEGLRRKLAL